MWEVASKKLELDQAVLAGGGQEQKPVSTAEQMNTLLRHGAYEMYKDGGREDDRALLEEDTDQILRRPTKIGLDAVGSLPASPDRPAFPPPCLQSGTKRADEDCAGRRGQPACLAGGRNRRTGRLSHRRVCNRGRNGCRHL
eukprot:EG_transcript_45836